MEPRVKLYVAREASSPIQLKCLDVTIATSTSLDVMLKKKSTNIGTLMEIENCPIRGQVSQGVRNWMKHHRMDIHGPGETDKKANDLQTRLFVARNLERYVGSVQTQRKAKVGYRTTEA